MHGLMQERPLSLPLVFRRVERYFGHKRVVTGRADGEAVASWSDTCRRARLLAAALDSLGVPDGACVGTFGWNSQRHVELYLAVPCTGRVEHLRPLVARWWIPEQILFLSEIPKTATGKFSKQQLRAEYRQRAEAGPEHDAPQSSITGTKEKPA